MLQLTLGQEIQSKEKLEGDIEVMNLNKQDLESRIQVLEAQVTFYRNSGYTSLTQVHHSERHICSCNSNVRSPHDY